MRWVAPLALLLAGCGEPVTPLPGEANPPPPCEHVIDGCSARRLDNAVLRGGATDGALGPIDGLDTSGVIGFDEALEAARANISGGRRRPSGSCSAPPTLKSFDGARGAEACTTPPNGAV